MTIDDLGLAVRNGRRGLGLTQEQLAASVSRITVARQETNRAADIGFRSLLRILNAVGLDLRLTDFNRGRPTIEDLAAEEQP